jgi:hypothetical protein
MCVVFGALLLCSAAASAQAPPSKSDNAVFDFSTSPDTLLISYGETSDMLANPDRTPRVRIFGDGLVWVHYPQYMKKAGDYGFYLDAGELQDLMRDVSAVFDFDPEDTMQAREAIRSSRENPREGARFRSDGTAEQLVVNLDSYRSAPSAASRSVQLDVTWRNIAADAAEFPDVDALQQLAAARQSIRSLLDRDDLVKLDSGASRN